MDSVPIKNIYALAADCPTSRSSGSSKLGGVERGKVHPLAMTLR
jgi:hypothetical protein